MTKWVSRSTIFAAFFAITSFVLALKGLLTGQYVAMCGAVQAMVTGRAIAEDYHERNSTKPEGDKG
jgi:hypothetical protein